MRRVGVLNGLSLLQNSRRIKPLILSLILSAGFLVLFQNCGSQEGLVNPLFDKPLATACLGPSCIRDEGYISIEIQNPNPTFVVRNTERGVDLAGFCDTGGFPQSRIYVEMRSQVGPVIPQYLSTSQCDSLGRFRVLVEFSPTHNYDLSHVITLIFRAVDENGVERDHPAGLNRKELTVITAP